ncbi:hypothetical protein [Streptomyces thermolilacinus]|uniref:hypothetical protein n=1 Tax=Streptomyces thermolilacinus TaxID=285540 RepID=UPI00340803F9
MEPITPTRIIPAGAPLPGGALPWYMQPPPPPTGVPPAPVPGPAPLPAPTGPVDVRVTVDVQLGSPEEPELRWWQRIRWAYNAGCALVSLPIAGPWAAVLGTCRDEQGLAGAWTIAAVPLAVLVTLDNARRIEAAAAHPDLWRPRARAALTRVALCAAVIATATALPVETVVYLLTGVRT